jgi:hypothetical protein
VTPPSAAVDVHALAAEIDDRIRALPAPSTEAVRRVRRDYSRRLRSVPPEQVLALALVLVDRRRWVAYELVSFHPGGLACLDAGRVERLGRGLDGWAAVDAFGCIVAGPAWRLGRVPDTTIQGWAASADRWWRRAALVSTVPLNLRSRGGTGDTGRTLDICGRLVDDRDDTVVKALSWALRALAPWDPVARSANSSRPTTPGSPPGSAGRSAPSSPPAASTRRLPATRCPPARRAAKVPGYGWH